MLHRRKSVVATWPCAINRQLLFRCQKRRRRGVASTPSYFLLGSSVLVRRSDAEIIRPNICAPLSNHNARRENFAGGPRFLLVNRSRDGTEVVELAVAFCTFPLFFASTGLSMFIANVRQPNARVHDDPRIRPPTPRHATDAPPIAPATRPTPRHSSSSSLRSRRNWPQALLHTHQFVAPVAELVERWSLRELVR